MAKEGECGVPTDGTVLATMQPTHDLEWNNSGNGPQGGAMPCPGTRGDGRDSHGEGSKHLCPLNRVPAGREVRIRALAGGAPQTQRLRELGFCEESVVRLINSQSVVVCLVCNARLAISAALAEQILVEPVRGCGTLRRGEPGQSGSGNADLRRIREER